MPYKLCPFASGPQECGKSSCELWLEEDGACALKMVGKAMSRKVYYVPTAAE